ncbi:MAG TPA: DNA-binding transcriptional regulator Fis [Gammaproteobacteria bacterium]|nr:DNA-binding transcriptional regulator Fis [Gammaproteobacteria bacterium]
MSIYGVQESHGKQKESHLSISRVSLAKQVKAAMEFYFQDIEGQTPSGLYKMVLNEVEKPLLESVMKQVRGNQTRAAEMLGLNRSTLRKKLQLYNL